MRPGVLDLTEQQKRVLEQDGHLLVTGGPGSGKTTVSILKAANIAEDQLRSEQKVLFLSFARATVSRVLEAIEQEKAISPRLKKLIEVDTYHSFFWRLIKAHGYLTGLPRRLTVLTPSAEAVALSGIRGSFKSDSKLSTEERKDKKRQEDEERDRLAREEGRVCFDLFAPIVAGLLNGSERIRKLVSTAYPYVILDEFQDTNEGQWSVVRAIGGSSILIALADPEQRIFDWIGADPARLDHFRAAFHPREFDFSNANHRSQGTEIAEFGNDMLAASYGKKSYDGVQFGLFEANQNQALGTLKGQTLQARKRLLATGKKNWSLAILVPTKRMTRLVSDALRHEQPNLPAISHTASLDVEAAILAAEAIAFLLEPDREQIRLGELVNLICGYFHGKGGDSPSQQSLSEAARVRAAFERAAALQAAGRPLPGNSLLVPTIEVYRQAKELVLTGNPDGDWTTVRNLIENSPCRRLSEIGTEARNIRLLDRGTQLRQALAADWLTFGEYRNGLEITRQAFVQEHFATAHKPETGVVVMNMHKAKGKQFDEVIIFEGWPNIVKGQIVANTNRIVRGNERQQDLGQARQNFRVSITRAKLRTTILTPRCDPCVLLTSSKSA